MERLRALSSRVSALTKRALFFLVFGVVPAWYVYTLTLSSLAFAMWQRRGGPEFFSPTIVQEVVVALLIVGLTLTRVAHYEREQLAKLWGASLDVRSNRMHEFLTELGEALLGVPITPQGRVLAVVASELESSKRPLFPLSHEEEVDLRKNAESLVQLLHSFPPSLRLPDAEQALAQCLNSLRVLDAVRAASGRLPAFVMDGLAVNYSKLSDSQLALLGLERVDDTAVSAEIRLKFEDAPREKITQAAAILEALGVTSGIQPTRMQEAADQTRSEIAERLREDWLALAAACLPEESDEALSFPETLDRLALPRSGTPWRWIRSTLAPASQYLYADLVTVLGTLPVHSEDDRRVSFAVAIVGNITSVAGATEQLFAGVDDTGVRWIVGLHGEEALKGSPSAIRITAREIATALQASGRHDGTNHTTDDGFSLVRAVP